MCAICLLGLLYNCSSDNNTVNKAGEVHLFSSSPSQTLHTFSVSPPGLFKLFPFSPSYPVNSFYFFSSNFVHSFLFPFLSHQLFLINSLSCFCSCSCSCSCSYSCSCSSSYGRFPGLKYLFIRLSVGNIPFFFSKSSISCLGSCIKWV